MKPQRKWNKGYNSIRRQLKRDLATLSERYEAGYGMSHDAMCDFAWQMYLKSQKLLVNDGAWVYVDRAYKLCDRKYRDDEYQEAKWISY